MLRSFEPIIDNNSKIIIIGTMPGVKSLEKQEYYGHERNSFWRIICSLFGHTTISEYSEKKAFLLEHHIALWDVLKACEREGSLDSNIKNPIPNDFEALFQKYPQIKAIYFNGDPAQKLFNKLVIKKIGGLDIPQYRLPSTSPANAIPFEQKLKHWRLVLLTLENLREGELKGFEACIRDFHGLSYEVYIDFSTLISSYKATDNGILKTEKTSALSEEALIEFIHRLFENGVLSWKENYSDCCQCKESTHWYLRLTISDTSYMFKGENTFPRNWEGVCKNIQNLIKEPFS